MHGALLRVDNSPFNQQQTEALNALLPSLTPDQALWLSGFLMGMRRPSTVDIAAKAAPPSSAQAAASPISSVAREVTVLFGSQTGNSQRLAAELVKRLEARGFQASLASMSEFKQSNLKKLKHLLVIVSTHGEGDPPDNAMLFYEFLHGKRAPQLEGLRYSVLALGDQVYDQFCKIGKDFDQRLAELGGQRIYPRTDCDVDYEQPAGAWMDGVLAALERPATSSADEPSTPTDGFPLTGSPPAVSTLRRVAAEREPVLAAVSATATATAVAAPAVESPAYSRTWPFPAEVLENVNLNGRGSDKETRHVKLSLTGSGLTFEPGDSLGIYPQNHPELVDDLIGAMGWSPDEMVPAGREERRLRDALIGHYEVTLLSRQLLKQAAAFSKDGLHQLVHVDPPEKLKSYVRGRDVLDLVQDFALTSVPARDFLPLLRKIPPRLYSIASSPRTSADEVDLTVTALRYQAHERERFGTCSVHCEERVDIGDKLPVFVHENPNFRMPSAPETPLIMIGPGTGVAPFRAFIEDREETGASGKTWLFFGDRRFRTDFLYQVEWQRWLKLGVLTRMDVAFSRDRNHKVYVQDRMREHGRDLYTWLEDGAHFYICGSIDPMAADVHTALVGIVEKEGGKTTEEAQAYVAALKEQGRYQRDVY